MNILGLLISSSIFVFALKESYEIWFDPQKYIDRVNRERKIIRTLLGFSYWKENGRMNTPLIKAASIFILLVCLLAIIVSITGPIRY